MSVDKQELRRLAEQIINARLNNAQAKPYLFSSWIAQASPAAILSLLGELEQYRKDALRYRWLCNGNGYFMEEQMLCHVSNDKEDADAAIDSAMAQEQSQ